ncbi:MAG: DNA-processing protein DprA [Deltaproteobacteria bacterium]|nr:DNA-processing protein DprA [Deltaproteobacteria bacterium]
MQGKLVPPPDLRDSGDSEARQRHLNALGPDKARLLRAESTWMKANRCRYWIPRRGDGLDGLGDDAPSLMFLRGELDLTAPAVAMVGSRKADAYGRDMSYRLGRALGQAGVVVVSGGALGIDRAAHEGALDGGGRTLVVMGGGLAVPHPPSNLPLFDRALSAGSGLVSEHPVGKPASRWTFPRRNRLIAALSDAVVVVQAARVSGALITADWALSLERPLFAVPADAWYLESRGTIDLLRKGALPLSHPSDLAVVPGLAELARLRLKWPSPVHRPRGIKPPWKDRDGCPVKRPDDQRSPLTQALSRRPMTLDELVESTGLTAGRVQGLVLELEVGGLVSRMPGGVFMLVEGCRQSR